MKKHGLESFKNFLWVTWDHLGLPNPTPVQYDIADYLQGGPRRLVIEAFRGVGKSYITSAFACHQLLLNPEMKILVVSASKVRADDFSTFTQRLIHDMPLLQHLVPKEGQRQSKISFDVAPASPSHSPSVKSVGITGQLAGSRADLIIADDIEIPNNSATQVMRDKLSESVKEFDAILKPDGRVIYLGTPQTEMSLYEELPNRGYVTRIWTARFPEQGLADRLGERLAPMLQTTDRVAEPTDPLRFDDDDLIERELSYGRSGFSLQFMLDTSLSDINKYPLKLSDLIVMNCDTDTAPERVVKSRDEATNISNLGLRGDKLWMGDALGDWLEYSGSVLAIDPSGRGKDETSYAVIKMLNGFLWLTDFGGIKEGGYEKGTLEKLAYIAKKGKVNEVIVESNFGDGMFNQLFTPYLESIYPVTLTEVRHHTQKEKRILDTLEPVMNQHKLVVDADAMRRDWESVSGYPPEKAPQYTLSYQMTRLTNSRGALRHDDRVDAVAIAVNYWVEQMSANTTALMSERRERLLDEELERFSDGILGRKGKGGDLWVTLK
jgi:hypothetical protein